MPFVSVTRLRIRRLRFLPGFVAEAARRLAERGRPSKVRHPAAAQERRETWPDGRVPRAGLPVRAAGR